MPAVSHSPNSAIDTVSARNDLESRRRRLESAAAARRGRSSDLQRLIGEVDDALGRLDAGEWGSCEVCHAPIEPECLASDPCRKVCLECLSEVERRRLEADLELAAEVQRSLLPRGALDLAGWSAFVHSSAAGAVGGDFVDLVESPEDGNLHFAVGDVAGKGVSAALLGAHLQALVRSSVTSRRSLGEQVSSVNRLFASVTPAGSYATLVWGVVGPDGRGELVNAGHLPVVAVGHRGCRLLESTGVPVGLFPGAQYSSSRFELAPGEQLLLVTDGLTESTDDADREYGVDALWSLVSRRDLELTPDRNVAKVLDDVARHRNGRGPHDDLTVVVLRRSTGPVAPAATGHRVSSSTL